VARVDLLCGGFPCQDVSVAGQRRGLAGSRSGLFHEFARIAGTLRPRWLLVENVPGLLSSNGGRDFGVVLGTLADLGYGLGWRVLDSRFFGVPQRRRRVFVVGALVEMILEPPLSVPARYSLSARAARGILRRAEKRGRTLPSHLSAALETVARTTMTDRQAV
jgi:DNA-cytosine methyltransferase